MHEKNNGPLQKGGPFPGPSVLKTHYDAGVSPTGSKPVACPPIGSYRCCADSVIQVLLKRQGIELSDDAEDIMVWLDGDEPELTALLKANFIPEGARWITVHPNGTGSKEQAVLVQEIKHGSSVFHVIWGAGSKLNYLLQ